METGISPATGSSASVQDSETQAFILTIAGALVLFVGTFLPFLTASAAFGGISSASQSWNLWTDNSGIILTALAIGSVVLARARMYLGLFATSIVAALVILYERGTIINAKNSLLGAFVHLEVSWAFWVLLGGAILLFVAGVMGKRAESA